MSKYANEQIKNAQRGLSLIEILVVVAIFAILGIIITRSVFLTLQGSKKSETLVNVGENINYAVGVIGRQLRNANSISDCTNTDTTKISYVDQDGSAASFSCVGTGTSDSYIASGSARLTSNTIKIIDCSFMCTLGTSANPPSVTIDIEAQDATASGVQNSTFSTTTQINLRSY